MLLSIFKSCYDSYAKYATSESYAIAAIARTNCLSRQVADDWRNLKSK
ncbi:hypothetical protein S7335_4135 [Synechococcus sp. PCC 7335]|nr:hypothetical protein S7335_4135 [Synechococcus sp. PCC 7335]